MDCTTDPTIRQHDQTRRRGPTWARNYPATVQEAERMLAASAIGSYRIETIGDWVDPPPKPLGDVFFERFAASVANAPEGYGRLFLHAIRTATGGPQNVA